MLQERRLLRCPYHFSPTLEEDHCKWEQFEVLDFCLCFCWLWINNHGICLPPLWVLIFLMQQLSDLGAVVSVQILMAATSTVEVALCRGATTLIWRGA